jgi:hypothetical protein
MYNACNTLVLLTFTNPNETKRTRVDGCFCLCVASLANVTRQGFVQLQITHA